MLPLKIAVDRVTVSVFVPPVMVSTFDTVAVLAKLPKLRVSLPTPRSNEALIACVESVIVSAAPPPTIDSTLPTVAELAKVPKVSVSKPPPKLMEPLTI